MKHRCHARYILQEATTCTSTESLSVTKAKPLLLPLFVKAMRTHFTSTEIWKQKCFVKCWNLTEN